MKRKQENIQMLEAGTKSFQIYLVRKIFMIFISEVSRGQRRGSLGAGLYCLCLPPSPPPCTLSSLEPSPSHSTPALLLQSSHLVPISSSPSLHFVPVLPSFSAGLSLCAYGLSEVEY